MSENTLQAIELEKCHVLLLEDGLVENRMKENIQLEVKDVLELKEVNTAMARGNKYCVLVTANHFNAVTADARRVSASPEFVGQTIAKALLVHNTATKLVGNAYITVNRPAIPTKLFSCRDSALAWLAEMKEQAGE